MIDRKQNGFLNLNRPAFTQPEYPQTALRRILAFGLVLCAVVSTSVTSLQADEPEWIWSPKATISSDSVSHGDCYFRKEFTLVRPEEAEMLLAAGDEFEVYINGRLAIRGQSYGAASNLDVGSFLQPGINLIAAKVRHNEGAQAGLAIRFRVREKGEVRWRSLTTNDTWRTRLRAIEEWKSTGYNDMGWLAAQTLGKYNPNAETQEVQKSHEQKLVEENSSQQPTGAVARQAVPAQKSSFTTNHQISASTSSNLDDQNQAARNSGSQKLVTVEQGKQQFEIDSEFTVEKIMGGKETGSLIAMEFNEFGKLLLSREGGPLLIADPTKQLTDPARVRVCCDQVTSCQGILPLNGHVYVTASGPKGLGLYRLTDTNRDGTMEVSQKLASFTGSAGEHGPHGLQLGPDGMLYVTLGNGSHVSGTVQDTSPYQGFYEGDLIPRYEDPGGHAKGIKAPGGTVVRVSLDGSTVETFAGGIRNAYDLVFDQYGDLFIHDSDMESDIGMTWYRPTMVFHVPAGAELGWRSGWAKFPQYFADQTPAVCETGRGSPSGATLYQHRKFPARYHNTMFFADWSEGRILTVRTQPNGAGHVAEAETFLKGRPLNVCDLAVGEDGGLYFCTGGRGTEGGVYRVKWNGEIPEKKLNSDTDLVKVIRHPQPNSAWARQNIAETKVAMGENWGPGIEGVAMETRNPEEYRLRALQLIVLYGPVPSEKLLTTLAKEESVEIRRQVARLAGLKNDKACQDLLQQLVTDSSASVRRAACEACMSIGIEPELSAILPMLNSTDRIEALSARRLIERIPADQWESEVFTTEEKRLFNQGALALMTADPNLKRAYKVLARASSFMEGFINDVDFVDMLRVMELALVQGEVDASRVPGLASRIENEFPSGSSTINRELARLLAYLKAGNLAGRLEEYLQDEDVSIKDKVHLCMNLQAIGNQLSPSARLAVIDTLEKHRNIDGAGGSYAPYLQKAVKDIAKTITVGQVNDVLRNGHRWPNAVVAAFYKMPEALDEETVQLVIEMDQAIKAGGEQNDAINQTRLGVIAVLARSGDDASMEYLRQLWQQEEDRRNDLVIGLSQQPGGENWAYLVSSIPVLDDLTGVEVIQTLASVSRRPRGARHFRDLIELGYRLRGQDGNGTSNLLTHWSGEEIADSTGDWNSKMDAWRDWFGKKFPGESQIVANVKSEKVGRYSVDQLLANLGEFGPGNSVMGHDAFVKAQCANCHHFNGEGQSVGPDLTNLAHRFSVREVIESTVDPSKVIPDRYASKTILTSDGIQISGMAIQQPDGSYFVLQSDGTGVQVAANNVAEIKESPVSAMPQGLLDNLSVSEINNLIAYLMQSGGSLADSDTKASSVSQTETAPVR